MYTRSYFTEDKKIDIPENYDGNAFRENGDPFKENVTEDAFSREDRSEENQKATEASAIPSFFGRLPISKLLSGLGGFSFKEGSILGVCQNFGAEEILIGAVALYLFFSKDGDRECAIMLLILLFIR